MRWLLLCLLLLPGASWAQRTQKKPAPKPAAAAAPSAWPIETLDVEGNRNYSVQQILAVAGLRRGQSAGELEFEAARKRLLETGAFETVGYRYDPSASGKGLNAKLIVTEIAQVYPVRFDDLNVPAAELEKHLQSLDPLFGKKIPGTRQVLERYARNIESYLAGRGNKEKIVAVVTPGSTDELVAVFRPAGAVPVVAEVNFRGNEVIPADALRMAISRVAVGAPFTERRMREILDMSVLPLYEARGRIRVAFPKIEAVRAKDVSGLVVTVDLSEGDSYELGEVNISGAGDPQELRKAAGFKPGEVANFAEIHAGVERVHDVLRRNGYMKVSSRIERKIDDEKKVVDLEIHLDPGQQFTFGKLEIKGLDLHGEAAVRKLWAMKEGKPFDASYPAFFLNRIREDGVFDNLGKTSFQTKVDEKNFTADVVLTFSGEPPVQKKKFP